ncbi:exodeoxyribonuclease VII large subunit [Solirhodobacter olei]|uniref:exodeoxyribonuclease VII large subunit n=1 Tax=Solirhodobacter olei TaxID=2493082 RepID=UPI000FDB6D0E|nr:exodeoxyribonuclease VII large subunit [Solirhodobacter olei]
MSDLIETDAPGNTPEFTVSELSGAVKRMIEGEFGFVRVRGEIGRVSRPASGHLYFDLKDERAVLAAIAWKGQAARLTTRPEEGMEVIATGRMTTFPGQSKYQMIVEDLVPAGAGALMAMLEKRKAQLAAEGLFDSARKKPIPYLPEVIGVITSPSGAVIRDILHRLRDRFPRRVLIWPVAVQGERCAPEVAAAIAGFNAIAPGGPVPRPDVLIVARGGGSLEDLWGFNEEVVARAAAASAIPLISAVGHETDTTLIDYAADLRAPTPTAAAELAVPVRAELAATLDQLGARRSHALVQALGRRGQRLSDLSRALPRPEALTAGANQKLDLLAERLPNALAQAAARKRALYAEHAAHIRPRLLSELVTRLSERLAARADRLRPEALLRESARRRERLDWLSQRLSRAASAQTEGWRARLDGLDRMRQTLGYTETLKRGFAVVRGEGGVLTTKAAAETAQALEIEFQDGRLSLGARPPRKSTPGKPPEQGSLF